ncbi:hypothetical protein ACFE04_016262 [Oxalis oulophora]
MNGGVSNRIDVECLVGTSDFTLGSDSLYSDDSRWLTYQLHEWWISSCIFLCPRLYRGELILMVKKTFHVCRGCLCCLNYKKNVRVWDWRVAGSSLEQTTLMTDGGNNLVPSTYVLSASNFVPEKLFYTVVVPLIIRFQRYYLDQYHSCIVFCFCRVEECCAVMLKNECSFRNAGAELLSFL